jgi:hypothetical protein
MGTQTEEQRKLDAEGKRIAQDVAAQLNMTEGKITKVNEAWLKSGAAGVIGATDGGSKGLNQRRHAEAKKLGAK